MYNVSIIDGIWIGIFNENFGIHLLRYLFLSFLTSWATSICESPLLERVARFLFRFFPQNLKILKIEKKRLIIFLLWISPCGNAYSVDKLISGLWRRYIKKEKNVSLLGDKTVPFWSIFFIQLQTTITFFFATTSKLQVDWLRGSTFYQFLCFFSFLFKPNHTGEPWIHYLSTSYRSRALTRYIIDIPFGFHPDAWMVLSLFPSFFFLPLLPYIPSPLNQHPKFACITCFLSLSCLLSLEAND